jgi:hypothetical protein
VCQSKSRLHFVLRVYSVKQGGLCSDEWECSCLFIVRLGFLGNGEWPVARYISFICQVGAFIGSASEGQVLVLHVFIPMLLFIVC